MKIVYLFQMKIFSILVLYKGDPSSHALKSAHDLSSFSFFQRSSVQEFMNFTAKIMTERTQIGDRQAVTEGEYKCHVYIRPDCLVGVCLTDHEYPHRVAHSLLTKVLDDFTLTVSNPTRSFLCFFHFIFLWKFFFVHHSYLFSIYVGSSGTVDGWY